MSANNILLLAKKIVNSFLAINWVKC